MDVYARGRGRVQEAHTRMKDLKVESVLEKYKKKYLHVSPLPREWKIKFIPHGLNG